MCIRTAILNALFLPTSFWRADRSYPYLTDYICALAFGRNTFPNKDIGTVYALHRAYSTNIAMFRYLDLRNFDPGHPNTLLAQRCIRLVENDYACIDIVGSGQNFIIARPIIGSWEILFAMYRERPDWYQKYQKFLFPIWPINERNPTTRDALEITKNIANQHKVHSPLIIAHPEHVQRCFFVARKIYGKSIAIDHDWNTGQEWFDKQSVQPRTRTPKAWFIYELCARIHHRLRGWM